MMIKLKTKSCVGCGFCCLKTPCGASLRLYGTTTRCPALRWDTDGKRYACRLMQLPGVIGERYRAELYAGAGCCAGLNTWRKDVQPREGGEIGDRIVPVEANPIPPIMQAFLRTLGQQMISSDVWALTCLAWVRELKKMGHSAEQAETLSALALAQMKSEQSSFMRDFMG